MSSKQPKEDRHAQSQLVPRCLVLVLKAKRDRRCVNKQQQQHDPRGERSPGWSPGPGSPQPGGCPANGPASPPPTTDSPSGGKGIFDSFQSENSGCYWNPHLEESIKNLRYMGVVQPTTLLVCGRDIYLDTVRNAFARKVLMPPVGFYLQKIGELDPVVMSLVQQTQFTPLPEALCVVIHELNCEGVAATLDTVQDQLADRYHGMQPPPEEIVYETLGSLMKERKIYHTGSTGTGYFIVTPDTYKNGCFNQAHLNPSPSPLPTVFLPLLSPASTEMRSISCQTELKETEEKTKVSEKEEKKKSKLERSQSLKGKSNKEKKAESLGRTASLRLGDEKAKQVIKDINLRTSEAHQDKDKGEKEKTSLFNKIFGRGKSRRSVAIEEDVPEEPEMEYATFSAQFPPPEWAWYEAQVPRATSQTTSPTSHMTSHMTSPTSHMTLPAQMSLPHMTSPQQHPPPMMRAHTWHHGQGVPHFDAGTQSDFDEEDYMKPHPHPDFVHGLKHGTTGHHTQQHQHQQHQHPQHHPHHPHHQLGTQVTAPHRHSSSSHSHESHSSSYEISPPPRSPRRPERDSHRRHSHRTSSKPRRHHESLRNTAPATLAATPPIANQNEYVQHEDDSHIYCEPSNPADMFGRSVSYEDAALSRGASDRLAPNAEPRSARTLPPKTHNGQSLNNGFVKSEHLPRSKSLTSPNRQKGPGKYRDMPCPSFCGNDISIEYNGRMPRKNGMFSLSRDSGVNCVGVKDSAGNNNNLSLKDKKLAFLNNQTGASGSKVTSSGGVNLNNHTRTESGTPVQHQLRPAPEYTISHTHQDSGFSSPRTDAENANYSGELMNSLPLNNISLENNNSGSNNRRPSSSDHPGQSRSLSRGTDSKTRDNVTRSASIGQRKDHMVGHGSGEQGKENRTRPAPAFKSLESVHITASEKYPSYGQLHITEDKDNMTASSRSGSSKNTVVEQAGDGGLAHGGGGAFLPYDANTSHASSDATYMEIQLVTSDCPVHGDSPQVTPRAHRAKDPEVSAKRHSMVKSSRHHNNQWRHSSAGQNHYGNMPGTNNNNNTEKDGKMHPSSKSRLAFLGDCEVVGIL